MGGPGGDRHLLCSAGQRSTLHDQAQEHPGEAALPQVAHAGAARLGVASRRLLQEPEQGLGQEAPAPVDIEGVHAEGLAVEQVRRAGLGHPADSKGFYTRLVISELRQVADQAFSRTAGAPLVPGNAVRLLCDARENYPAWLEAIAAARRYVHFEMYILAEDAVGERFAQALAGKAREGVGVRLLYDWMGGLGTPRVASGGACARRGSMSAATTRPASTSLWAG